MKKQAPKKNENLEDAFQSLFASSISGNGDEELLRIAGEYSMQLSARQIRALLRLKLKSYDFLRKEKAHVSRKLELFISQWLLYKRNHNSDLYVMRALDSIALRKFIGENSVKVDIQK